MDNNTNIITGRHNLWHQRAEGTLIAGIFFDGLQLCCVKLQEVQKSKALMLPGGILYLIPSFLATQQLLC